MSAAAATAAKLVTPTSRAPAASAIPLRRGEPDADAGKTAGPDRGGDNVERPRLDAGRARDAVDHRQQRLGMAVTQRAVLGGEHLAAARDRRRAARARGLDREQQRLPTRNRGPARRPGVGASHGPDLDHFGDVMAQHVLDPGLQGRGRTGAAGAGTLHVQVDDAVLEILEGDVAAIHRHRRAHPRFQQFLDLGDDLVVFLGRAGAGGFRRADTTGRPAVKCSMIAASTAGFSWCQSLSAVFVTVMKSVPRKTPPTSGS